MSPRRRVAWSAAISAWLMGASLGLGQNTSYTPDVRWQAPVGATARKNPLADKPEAAVGGKKLFLRNCTECHGIEGQGMVKKHAADLQLLVVQQESDGALFWKITNGNPDRGMPSFSRLPELQRWQLILFLRTLKPVNPPASAEAK